MKTSNFPNKRKRDHLGPYGMWSKLLHTWSDKLSPQQIYEKVRFFFWCYGINRHKMTTLTPSYHAEQYGPDVCSLLPSLPFPFLVYRERGVFNVTCGFRIID